jgi:predicted RNA methylase
MIVPFVPTPDEVAREMLKCAEAGKQDIVLDLGAGVGKILKIAKEEFNVKLAIGVEIDKKLCKEAYFDNGREIEIICGDLLTLAPILLPRADVLVSYLSTRANELLEPYIIQYGKKGMRVISHDFQYEHLKLIKVKRVKAMGILGYTDHTIYCYQL